MPGCKSSSLLWFWCGRALKPLRQGSVMCTEMAAVPEVGRKELEMGYGLVFVWPKQV